MMRLSMPLMALLWIGCAAHHTQATTEALFDSPAAEVAKERAPDLHQRAVAAWSDSEEAARDGSSQAADDRRTEAHLWLAAAATEAERIETDRERREIEAEEERWARQLARDQEASAVVARDISRYEARSVALQEADRISELEPRSDENTVTALLNRAQMNLALARALGAPEAAVRALDDRADMISARFPTAAPRAESLLLETEALIGDMRAQWPEPLPGASADLVDTAAVMGFAADRGSVGVLVRSDAFFTSSGQISAKTVERFHALVAAFPHGPIACQVAVPEGRRAAWSRRVASLVERFAQMEEPGRVSTGMIATSALEAGTVQCTFAAYRGP
jgi:hypothetical protein